MDLAYQLQATDPVSGQHWALGSVTLAQGFHGTWLVTLTPCRPAWIRMSRR